MVTFKEFAAKNRVHIVIWALMIVYLLSARYFYLNYFVKDTTGKPVHFEQDPSLGKSRKIKYAIRDLVDVGNGNYRLSGWAYLGDPSLNYYYDRYVVLSSEDETYYFPIVKSGKKFSTDISKEYIIPGDYRISFVFRQKKNGQIYFSDTNRTITRTPNYLFINK